MPKLVIRVEGKEARSFPLDADTIKVGSAEGSGICVPGPDVSGEHCEIRRSGLQYRLVDLESKVGSKVNGIYVNQHILEENDEIELGSVKLRFERDAAANGHLPPPPAFPSRRQQTRGPQARAARPSRRGPPPRSNSAPLILACIGVALLLVVVLVMASGSNGPEADSPNADILQQVLDLERLGRLEEALAIADRADSSKDRATFDRIDRLAQSIRARLSPGSTPLSSNVQARKEAELLLTKIARRHSSDPSHLLTAVDAYLQRYSDLTMNPYVDRVRAERPVLLARSRGENVVEDNVASRFVKAQKEADDLTDKRFYGKALDVYGDYLDRNQAFFKNAKERDTYSKRVEVARAKVMEYADSAWEKLDRMAKKRVTQGTPERALKLYRRVVEDFGIPVMEEQAAQAIRKITGR
jgi:FHA domain-containing protein